VGEVNLQGTREASELGAAGISQVHFVVGPHGVPLRFQVVRAVGAGLDEATLQTVSESRFKPAMKDGVAVAADSDLSVTYEAPRPE
jgi:TonB family protein